MSGRKCSPGEKSFQEINNWLPDETVETFRKYLVGIKGPLTTPVGGGIRSLNVALRQLLDLFVCLRPVRWYQGVPSPVKHPEKVDMVIFRENTEDIYAGIEYAAGSPEAQKVLDFFAKEFPEGVQEDPLRDARGSGSAGRRSSRRSARPSARWRRGRRRTEADQPPWHGAAGAQRASATPSSTSARA